MQSVIACHQEFIGRPFVKRFALCYRSVVCLSVLSVTLVYCGQTVGRIKIKLNWHAGRPRPGHIVLDEDPASPTQKGHSPHPKFSAMSVVAKRLDGPRCHLFGTEIGLGEGDFMLDGDPAPQKRRHSPNFRPMSIVAKRLDGSRCHLVRR